MLSKNKALAVLGALVLGGLGSGIWDLVFRPGGMWLGHTVLSAVTFGSTSVRDAVYREAARGLHEGSSLMVYSFLVGLIGAAPLYFFVAAFIDKRRFEDQQLLRARRRSGQSVQELEGEISRLKTEMGSLDRRLGKLTMFRYIAVAALLVPSLTVSFQGLKLVEANDAFTYFSQSLIICRPYMTDQDAHILNSRFAQIRGRSDYVVIIDELQKIAGSNHVKLPEYNPM